MDSGPNLVHPHNLYTTRLSEERLSVSLTGGGVRLCGVSDFLRVYMCGILSTPPASGNPRSHVFGGGYNYFVPLARLKAVFDMRGIPCLRV